MIEPALPSNEEERLEELISYNILDAMAEKDYDNLTAIASEICDTPISLISLIDDKRQWFMSNHGLDVKETPKEYAFCAHAIHNPDDVLIVQDSRTDERFVGNPLLDNPGVIFYAGVPLKTKNGYPLGTLCVIDNKPKLLSQSQIKSLRALSNQVMNLLELRKSEKLLKDANILLTEKNAELERYAFIAAHDLKSPLINMSGLLKLFNEKYEEKIDPHGIEILKHVGSSCLQLRKLIDGLLEYSNSNKILKEKKTEVNLRTLEKEIRGLFTFDNEVTITIDSTLETIEVNNAAINQILINAVSNAIKYNDKNHAVVDIEIKEDASYYYFQIGDNGPGVRDEDIGKLFDIYTVLSEHDQFGEKGNGIGLATIKKLIANLGGTIRAESPKGKGLQLIFNISK